MKKKIRILFLMVFSLLIFFCLFSMSIGKYPISIPDIIKTLCGAGTKMQETVIYSIRLPRICVAVFVGAALAVSGCILQTVTKNELAEPGIIGINAGSSLAVILLISAGSMHYYDEIRNGTVFLMPFVSILGAFLAAMIIYGLSLRKRKVTPTRFLLVGIGVNAGINAAITVFQLNMSKGDYNQALTWISGSLWGTSWRYFYFLAPITLLMIFLTMQKSRVMDVMDLGDELATGLGVLVERERRILLFYAVVLAAMATAVAGNIAFLGLLGPHIAKKLCGPMHARQIPLAAGISAIIIVAADLISKNLFSPLEIPVGITISLIGVPYFVFLMMKQKD